MRILAKCMISYKYTRNDIFKLLPMFFPPRDVCSVVLYFVSSSMTLSNVYAASQGGERHCIGWLKEGQEKHWVAFKLSSRLPNKQLCRGTRIFLPWLINQSLHHAPRPEQDQSIKSLSTSSRIRTSEPEVLKREEGEESFESLQ